MKILVIGAHPADPIDLAGGTLILHAKSGDEIVMATVTDGIWSHSGDMWFKFGEHTTNSQREDSILQTKRSEFSKAGKVIGVKSCESFGRPDEPLVMNASIVHSIASTVREHKPDIVITHHPHDYTHWDHRECGEIVCRALKAAIKLPSKNRHWVPALYFFSSHFRAEGARLGVPISPPDVLVDILKVKTLKMKAMACLKSQYGEDCMGMLKKRMASYESEIGRADGLECSEGFILGIPLKRGLLPQNSNINFYQKKEGKGR